MNIRHFYPCLSEGGCCKHLPIGAQNKPIRGLSPYGINQPYTTSDLGKSFKKLFPLLDTDGKIWVKSNQWYPNPGTPRTFTANFIDTGVYTTISGVWKDVDFYEDSGYIAIDNDYGEIYAWGDPDSGEDYYFRAILDCSVQDLVLSESYGFRTSERDLASLHINVIKNYDTDPGDGLEVEFSFVHTLDFIAHNRPSITGSGLINDFYFDVLTSGETIEVSRPVFNSTFLYEIVDVIIHDSGIGYGNINLIFPNDSRGLSAKASVDLSSSGSISSITIQDAGLYYSIPKIDIVGDGNSASVEPVWKATLYDFDVLFPGTYKSGTDVYLVLKNKQDSDYETYIRDLFSSLRTKLCDWNITASGSGYTTDFDRSIKLNVLVDPSPNPVATFDVVLSSGYVVAITGIDAQRRIDSDIAKATNKQIVDGPLSDSTEEDIFKQGFFTFGPINFHTDGVVVRQDVREVDRLHETIFNPFRDDILSMSSYEESVFSWRDTIEGLVIQVEIVGPTYVDISFDDYEVTFSGIFDPPPRLDSWVFGLSSQHLLRRSEYLISSLPNIPIGTISGSVTNTYTDEDNNKSYDYTTTFTPYADYTYNIYKKTAKNVDFIYRGEDSVKDQFNEITHLQLNTYESSGELFFYIEQSGLYDKAPLIRASNYLAYPKKLDHGGSWRLIMSGPTIYGIKEDGTLYHFGDDIYNNEPRMVEARVLQEGQILPSINYNYRTLDDNIVSSSRRYTWYEWESDTTFIKSSFADISRAWDGIFGSDQNIIYDTLSVREWSSGKQIGFSTNAKGANNEKQRSRAYMSFNAPSKNSSSSNLLFLHQRTISVDPHHTDGVWAVANGQIQAIDYDTLGNFPVLDIPLYNGNDHILGKPQHTLETSLFSPDVYSIRSIRDNNCYPNFKIVSSGYEFHNSDIANIPCYEFQDATTFDSTIDGSVISVTLENHGYGYQDAPIVHVGGSAIVTSVIEGPIKSINIINGGKNYRTPPTINFIGQGIPPILGDIILSSGQITKINIIDGGLYRSLPSVIITDEVFTDANGESASLEVVLDGRVIYCNIIHSGSMYQYPPDIVIESPDSSYLDLMNGTITRKAYDNLPQVARAQTSIRGKLVNELPPVATMLIDGLAGVSRTILADAEYYMKPNLAPILTTGSKSIGPYSFQSLKKTNVFLTQEDLDLERNGVSFGQEGILLKNARNLRNINNQDVFNIRANKLQNMSFGVTLSDGYYWNTSKKKILKYLTDATISNFFNWRGKTFYLPHIRWSNAPSINLIDVKGEDADISVDLDSENKMYNIYFTDQGNGQYTERAVIEINGEILFEQAIIDGVVDFDNNSGVKNVFIVYEGYGYDPSNLEINIDHNTGSGLEIRLHHYDSIIPTGIAGISIVEAGQGYSTFPVITLTNKNNKYSEELLKIINILLRKQKGYLDYPNIGGVIWYDSYYIEYIPVPNILYNIKDLSEEIDLETLWYFSKEYTFSIEGNHSFFYDRKFVPTLSHVNDLIAQYPFQNLTDFSLSMSLRFNMFSYRHDGVSNVSILWWPLVQSGDINNFQQDMLPTIKTTSSICGQQLMSPPNTLGYNIKAMELETEPLQNSGTILHLYNF